MRSLEFLGDFLDAFVTWASVRPDIQGVALVGSYARGTAREDSDIDLLILTDDPVPYIESPTWVKRFGAIERYEIEAYGAVTSLRVWHLGGYEVEYGIAAPAWAASPLDEGTRQVIENGMIVLFERGDLLSRHVHKTHK